MRNNEKKRIKGWVFQVPIEFHTIPFVSHMVVNSKLTRKGLELGLVGALLCYVM